MAANIDYFFSHISPWAYLGHKAFLDMAARHGLTVRFRPVNLGKVFPETGGLPLAQRHPARQAYRWIELQRWQRHRGVPITFKPAYFPTDPTLADCTALAIAAAGRSPGTFCGAAMAACWVEDRNIAEESVIADVLASVGEDAVAIIAASGSEEVKETYETNIRDAIEIPAFGSPCYVRDGEPFWGQDRIEILEEAIKDGRKPYKPL